MNEKKERLKIIRLAHGAGGVMGLVLKN